jgi:hypothetical protein
MDFFSETVRKLALVELAACDEVQFDVLSRGFLLIYFLSQGNIPRFTRAYAVEH